MAFPAVVAALINQKPKTAVLGTKVSGMKAVVFQWFLWYQLSMIFIHSLEYKVFQFASSSQKKNKKAQLSLTNPRDTKVCQKLLQFDVLTTLSLTILAHLHAFSCCSVRNPAKFTKNSNLWSSRSSKVINLGVNGKPIFDFILVINSNFSRICYRFRDIHG